MTPTYKPDPPSVSWVVPCSHQGHAAWLHSDMEACLDHLAQVYVYKKPGKR
jgi:hypothetical protein